MPIRQTLALRQTPTLAPRLQQSLKLLQMPTLDLQQAVRRALASNPFLEAAEDDPAADSADPNARPAPPLFPDPVQSVLPPDPAEPARDAADPRAAADLPPAWPGDYPRPPATSDQDPAQRQPGRESLHARLLRALGLLPLSQRDHELAAYLIHSLDDDGYLRLALDDLTGSHRFEPVPEACEWRIALHHVQHLLAAGIGARDLRECLRLQLQALNPADATREARRQLAITLVDHHLPRMARNDWAGLQQALGADEARVRAACELIRTLDPRPGRRYDAQPTACIIPEVVVDKVAGQWRIRLNRAAMPRARLHQQYADWLDGVRRAPDDPLVRELRQARWLIQNLALRHTTLHRVTVAIVRRQRRFFDYGDVALRPLRLREIADDLDLHESTISRAIAGKHMVTPRGLYPLRHFFSRELATQAGGTCSANAVRALIRELVAAEDAAQPLSDVALTRRLAQQGIRVARRTVTKYRNQLGIPAVGARR